MKYQIALLVLVIGLIIYKIRPRYVVLFWMTWQPFLIPLLVFLFGAYNPEDDALIRVAVNVTSTLFLFFTLVFLEILRGRKVGDGKHVVRQWTILYLYILLMTCATHFSSSVLIMHLIDTISLVFPFVYLFMIDEAKRPTLHELAVFSITLIGIEAIAVYLNTKGFYFYMSAYLNENFRTANGEYVNLVSGTFQRFNALTNYLTTLYLYISLQYYANKELSKVLYLVLSIMVGFMILLSGSKMSILLYVFTIIACVYCYQRKKIFRLLISTAILAILVYAGSKYLYVVADMFPGAERIVSGFEKLIESGHDSEESTTSLSTYLIDRYFYESSILGNWRTWMGANAYLWQNYDLTLFRADARVAYILVEFGLVGFVLYLLFFFSFFRVILKRVDNSERMKIKIIILYFCILTITEPGFFDPCIFPLSFIYLICVLKYKPNIYNRKNDRRFNSYSHLQRC